MFVHILAFSPDTHATGPFKTPHTFKYLFEDEETALSPYNVVRRGKQAG